MSAIVTLKGAVDGATIHIVPGVALVTPAAEQQRNAQGAPTGPPQTIIGESIVQFFGSPGGLRIKGAPLDVANQIAGKPALI